MNERPVITANNLSLEYKLGKGWLNAINDVSVSIAPLEIHGLVGESGSGKSTFALALMNYLAANARIKQGEVLLDGENLVDKIAGGDAPDLGSGHQFGSPGSAGIAESLVYHWRPDRRNHTIACGLIAPGRLDTRCRDVARGQNC